jgi:type II secretory pathway pseudopilin PulG
MNESMSRYKKTLNVESCRLWRLNSRLRKFKVVCIVRKVGPDCQSGRPNGRAAGPRLWRGKYGYFPRHAAGLVNLRRGPALPSETDKVARPIAQAHRDGPNLNRRFPGQSGFVLHVALMLLLAVSAVAGFFLYSAYDHSNAIRRAHDADQCLLDAQSALEQVKYDMIQAYGSNGQASVTWFLNWSSNAIGATPRYYIPSPLTVNETPVFVTLTGVFVFTNAGNNFVNLTLVADAWKANPFPVRRKILEQMLVSAGTGGVAIVVTSALGKYGANAAVNVSGTLLIDGHNWNLPAVFNSGNGNTNRPSTNDMPGVAYDSTGISASAKISINGNPSQTNAGGADKAAYWRQFLNAITPAATIYTGGGDSFGTRTAPVIKIFPSGATTIASARSGAGILIIPGGATVKFNQAFNYEGMVIIGSSGNNQNVSMTVNNTATIYGNMICLGSAGALDIIVSGSLNVLYSKQAVANLASITNLSAVLSGGGDGNGAPYVYQWREIH